MLVSQSPSKALLCLPRLFAFLKQDQLQASAKQAGAWEMTFAPLCTSPAAERQQARLEAAAAATEGPCVWAAPPEAARAEVVWESPS